MRRHNINETYNLIHCFINKYFIKNILLAISGGQDSIYLINTLEKLKKKEYNNKITISYIYIDHQWKHNSYQQLKHIINYIKLINSNIIVYQIKKVTLSEDECRRYRYNIIIQHSIKYNFQLIITGHNANDKVETFMQNTIKGSSIESLSNLVIKNKIYNRLFILRPLLKLNRTVIYWTCKKFYLPIWSDATNYFYKIQRNRIRQELIPYIQQYIHSNIENNIKLLINNYYYQNEYIKQSVLKLYLKSKHNKRIAINYTIINKQNFILQIKVIQLFCFQNIQTYLESQKITKIMHEINQGSIALDLSQIVNYNNFKFFIYNSWMYLKIKV
uniref:tRNA(Ile)-lysidine synthase, chloroplastic n=1 Tax=Periphykon beckeri TaxID=2006982 RepID=A0A1Z1M2R2_9FLOR|nr:tRNA Ile-lysidine synthetase [Periphykon beckeri]ARW60348.1 tRNA Ile-lysidine synthetase [Periphykon beckeri]